MDLNHLLSLLGAKGSIAEVAEYDADSFAISKNDQGAFEVGGVAGFDGEKSIVVKTDADSQQLTFKLDTLSVEKAGSYEGTLSYTASVA